MWALQVTSTEVRYTGTGKARGRNDFPTAQRGNYCFPHPLVTKSNFIT